MSTTFTLNVRNGTNSLMQFEVDSENYNCLDTDFMTPNPFLGQTFTLAAETTYKIRLCKRDGHGCDGRQGEFRMRPIFIDVNGHASTMDWQKFSFNSDGGIKLEEGGSGYISNLVQPKPGLDSEWTCLISLDKVPNDIKADLLAKYAPVVWLHNEEEYMPCSTEFAFPYMKRWQHEDLSWWIVTKAELSDGGDDNIEVFKGNLATAKCYAFVSNKEAGIDLVYFQYYAYNRGKSFLGTIWGNHVGDWEHVTVRLDHNLNPGYLLMSQHDNPQILPWIDIDKEGDRPIVYSAKGSHGLYKDSGDHGYGNIAGVELVDRCAPGTKWTTASSLVGWDFATKASLTSPATAWPVWMSTDYHQAGDNPTDPSSGPIYRWGNTRMGCTKWACRLEDGPTGPPDKGDCWDVKLFG